METGNSTDFKDRRKYPRFEGLFQVDLLNMGDDPAISPFEVVVKGTALDVSKQGIRLQAIYNVNVGSKVSAVFYYKGRESVCLCKVMWKREEMGQFLYGLYIDKWSQMDPLLQKQLDTMEKTQAACEDSPPTGHAVVTSLSPLLRPSF